MSATCTGCSEPVDYTKALDPAFGYWHPACLEVIVENGADYLGWTVFPPEEDDAAADVEEAPVAVTDGLREGDLVGWMLGDEPICPACVDHSLAYDLAVTDVIDRRPRDRSPSREALSEHLDRLIRDDAAYPICVGDDRPALSCGACGDEFYPPSSVAARGEPR